MLKAAIVLATVALAVPLFTSLAAESPVNVNNLTRKQFEALPKAQKRKLPLFKVFPLLLQDKKTTAQQVKAVTVLGVEDALYELRFYTSLPTGRETGNLRTAIKKFQRSAGYKPTGVLLLGEWEELVKRKKGLRYYPISLPSLSYYASGNWVIVKGTWRLRRGFGESRQSCL